MKNLKSAILATLVFTYSCNFNINSEQVTEEDSEGKADEISAHECSLQSFHASLKEKKSRNSRETAAKKIYICHFPPGNPSNYRTLSISINALGAHLDHPDLVGRCEDYPLEEIEEFIERFVLGHDDDHHDDGDHDDSNDTSTSTTLENSTTSSTLSDSTTSTTQEATSPTTTLESDQNGEEECFCPDPYVGIY